MRERVSFHGRAITIVCLLIVSLCPAILKSQGESRQIWQVGAIVEVKAHQAAPGENSEAKQYDISVKVGKKIYFTLYTMGGDQWQNPENYVGIERPVLIEGNTLKFNDLMGRTHSMRILKSKDAPPEKQE